MILNEDTKNFILYNKVTFFIGEIVDKQLQKWKKTREKGKIYFFWIKGFLGWGLLTAIIWLIGMEILTPGNILHRCLIAFTIFPISGYFLFVWVWRRNENRYSAKDTKVNKYK